MKLANATTLMAGGLAKFSAQWVTHLIEPHEQQTQTASPNDRIRIATIGQVPLFSGYVLFALFSVRILQVDSGGIIERQSSFGEVFQLRACSKRRTYWAQ